ncbi:MAG: biotin--[Bacteroides sp.]|nr:biotin--[acetyl-CoA-carboxylase] ligase [Bacteroides sp.]
MIPSSLPPIIEINETDSTNRFLLSLCHDLKSEVTELTTVVADHQTAGKGQRGNSWEAEAGKNLLFSFVCYPRFLPARRQFILSQIVSLAIKEELEQHIADVSIKWPNDIYWQEKKICGILIENDLSQGCLARSIVGIGLNINQERFVSNAPNPTSLRLITGREHDRKQILAGIMERMAVYYNALRLEEPASFETDINARYARSLFRRRGYHTYRDADGLFQARLLRVEPDGRFVLEDENGREREYLFKEVQYVL